MASWREYLLKYIIYTVIIAVVSLTLFSSVFAEYYFRFFPLLFIIIFGATLGFHSIMMKYSRESVARFTGAYMLATVIKMLVYLILIISYLYFLNEKPVSFVVTFLVLYFLFTSFEVFELVRFNKKK